MSILSFFSKSKGRVPPASTAPANEPPATMDIETVIVTKPRSPTPNRGFFSMITQAVSNLHDLRGQYSRFYFDYSENALYRDLRFGEQNYFNNYFEQDKSLLASPRKKFIDWTTDWALRRDAWHSMTGVFRDEVSGILRQHLRIKERILLKIDAIRQEKFEGRKILGLHKRGTDHHLHGELLGIDNYYSVVDQHIDQYDCLYLATDEDDTLHSFKQRYKDKLIYVEDFYRSSDRNCVHEHNFADNYKKGEDVLIEAVLLSSVDLLLKTRSNITLFSILYNRDLPYKQIDPHIQYH